MKSQSWLSWNVAGLLLFAAAASVSASAIDLGPFGGPGFPHPSGFGATPAPYAGARVPGAGDHSGCALIIPGPGKTSGIDYPLGGFSNAIGAYDGPGTCITYDAVNHAFHEAKGRFGLPAATKRDLSNNDIGQIGRVLVETSKILAHQYSLPADAITSGLPLIDTSRTVIDQYCPYFLKFPNCEPKRYRTYTGLCNNLDKPHLGAAQTAYKRLLPPAYADGLEAPRVGYGGHPLPSPRVVSAHVHRDEGYHDHAVTVMLIAWGQAIDHDMTFAAESKKQDGEDPKCCDYDSNHQDCFPIQIPGNDPFYSLFNRKCMSFVRNLPGAQYACKLGPRLQFNTISSLIDGNFVYGTTKEVVDALRTYQGGYLKTLPVFQEFGLKDLLPLKTSDADDGCLRPQRDIYCFLAGDNRVNEQLVLAVVHTIFVREHNRLVYELNKLNPHWDDETLYQEARHIVVALIQHITYNEFLPMVLGKEVMHKYGIILQKEGYFGGYDPKVNPSASAAFVTSAFRFGHSLLPSTIERWSTNHKYIGSQRLSELLRQPYDLYKGGWCDQYMCGLMNQVAQAMDDSVTQEVTNHLFQMPGMPFGFDLAAFNMQRGREQGVASYNNYRQFCGLPRATHWHDLLGTMPNATVRRYSEIYASPDDIDLWSGGLSERPLPGSLVGPTFACIIGLQFRDLRHGDRFWYENGGWPSSFTLEQLQEIRQIKLSRLICDTGDKVEEVQVYAMVLPDHEINPRVPCKSGILPRLDITRWKDTRYRGPGPVPAPGPGPVPPHGDHGPLVRTTEAPHDPSFDVTQSIESLFGPSSNKKLVDPEFGIPLRPLVNRKDEIEPIFRPTSNSTSKVHRHPYRPLHGPGFNPPPATLPSSQIYDRKTLDTGAPPAPAQQLVDKISEEVPGGDSLSSPGDEPLSDGDENYVTDEISVPTGTGLGTPGKVRVVHHGVNGVKSVTYVSPKVLKSIIAPSSYGFGSKPPPGMPPGHVIHHFHPPTLTVHDHPSGAALLPGSAPAPSHPPRRIKKRGKGKKKKSKISGWFRRRKD